MIYKVLGLAALATTGTTTGIAMMTRTKTMKNSELKELVKQGTNILNEIKAVEHTIELTHDRATLFQLNIAKTNLQKQFNEIFDKVFGGEAQ